MELLIQAAIGVFAGLFGGLLGVGGSLVIIPAMIFYYSHFSGGYAGPSQHLLQAAAMICNVFIAAPAAVAHWRAKAILPPVVVYLIPSALAGILLGVAASNGSAFARENGVYLAMLLSVFLAYVAVYNGWRLFRRTDLEGQFDASRRIAPWRIAAVGIPMGVVAGLLGIGGGAIAVPTQQVILRIPLRRAIANSAATIVFSSAFGAIYKNLTLTGHGVTALASIQLAAMLLPTAVLGSYLGGRLTHVLPRSVLRAIFIVFMASVSCVTFSEAWHAATALH